MFNGTFDGLFRDKKNERLGLLVATIIFGLVGTMQLWRAFAGVSVEFGGHSVPMWLSVVVGITAIIMSLWMGLILRHNRPIL